MHIDFSTLPAREAYGWMAGTILPRPIAWVSSISAEGKTNLAPFSFFQGVCASPPTLLFTVSTPRDGAKKDTLRNIEQVPEFVVNFVPHALAETMNATASLLPYGESEFETFKISSVASAHVRPPRVALSPAAFECRLDRIVNVGEGPMSGTVIFGRILAMHVDNAIVGADGAPDAARLDLVGRLGGNDYTTTRDRFSLKRPDR